jgi:ankyrin repeat protein
VSRLLVARGAKLNAGSNKGSTAMHIASSRGRLEAVRFLLDAGADARSGSAGDNRQTPLQLAVIHGHLGVVRELARRLGPEALNVRAEFDLKAVHFAALYGHLEIMRFLLDECRVSIEELGGKTESTPLYQACEKGHCAVAAELVARGARINAKSKHSATPLFIASQNGHAAAVAQMLEAGADMAAAKPGGFAPLHTAVEHAHAEVVRVLLEYGADPLAPLGDGRTSWAMLRDEPKFAQVRQLLVNFGGGPVPLPRKLAR